MTATTDIETTTGSGAPTVCRQGTNAPSSPIASSAAWPMRVMIRIETAT